MNEQNFPIIPCSLCGAQENLARVRIRKLIDQLATENPKIPSNMLHALKHVQPSQLMDQSLWDFKTLNSVHDQTNFINLDFELALDPLISEELNTHSTCHREDDLF